MFCIVLVGLRGQPTVVYGTFTDYKRAVNYRNMHFPSAKVLPFNNIAI
jgi:hypothetical protein